MLSLFQTNGSYKQVVGACTSDSSVAGLIDKAAWCNFVIQ